MKEFPPFRLDIVNQCLWRRREAADDERILLTPKAFAVLRYLVAHAGQLVSQEELLEAAWPETYVQPEVLKSRIFEIRSALADRPKTPRFIETLPRRGYRFIATVHEAPAVEPAIPLPPADGHLVGRSNELETLHACLHRAMQGQRQIVFVTGEPGIGKTALVDAFEKQATSQVPGLRLARGQCLEGYGGMEAYYPMLEALGQLWRGAGVDAIVQILATHAPTWLVQFPALVTREHRDTLQQELLGATRERMLREIAEALEIFTATRPLLLIFEDLQWVDPATVDLLAALARRRGPAHLLLIGTYRPANMALGQPPLQALAQELRVHHLCHDVAVEPLHETDIAAYLVATSAAAILPEGLTGLVYRHSEGNPLFMRAVLDHLTQQGSLVRERRRWRLRASVAERAFGIPEGLRQMIEVMIERLRPEEQQVLEVASVVGSVFTVHISAAAMPLAPEHFEELCETLARRQHLVRAVDSQQFPDGSRSQRYAFIHALYRDVLYWRQAPGRRATLHRHLGERLEGVFATQLSDVAPELAYHFEAAAAWTRAVMYLRLVADMAAQRFAHREAANTLRHAITLVNNLPEVERPQHVLPLYIALGAVLQTAHGSAAPEVEHIYHQAHKLCQQMGETPELVPVLLGLWRFYAIRPQLHIARELGDMLLRLTQTADDPALAVVGYYALGCTELWLGTLSAARQHLEAGIAHYTPDQHHDLVFRTGNDPGVACQFYAAMSLWLLGYSQQAMVRLQEGLALAHALGHPYSLAFARGRAAYIYQLCRDVPAVHAHAEAAVALSTAQGFPLWAAWGMSFCGWALGMQGQGEAGIAQIRQGITAWQATGALVTVPYLYTVLAEVYDHIGHTEDGLQALAEAHTLVEQLQERWWEAEIYRLRGALLLRHPETPQEEAEAWLQRALDMARRQEAKALELRAAMSLAHLWQRQGKRDEARALLAPVYGWFTEGFDTADLQKAKALLDALR